MTDPEHLAELDCDPCDENGVVAWFPTAEALEAHVTAAHPEYCARCLSHEAERRQEKRIHAH
jgi:hypothetical protein